MSDANRPTAQDFALLFAARSEAKRTGNSELSMALKRVINYCYGQFASSNIPRPIALGTDLAVKDDMYVVTVITDQGTMPLEVWQRGYQCQCIECETKR